MPKSKQSHENGSFPTDTSYDDDGDNSVLLYNLPQRKIEHHITPSCGTVLAVAISRNGRFAAVSGHLGTEVYDCVTGKLLSSLDDVGLSHAKMFVGAEGDMLIGTDQAQLFYSLSEEKVIARFPPDTSTSQIRFSTSGRHWMRTTKTGIEVANVVPSEIRSIQAHTINVGDVTFSPDARLVATSGEDDPVRIWDVASGRLIQEFNGNQAAFHPSGRLLAIKTYEQLKILKLPEAEVIATVESALHFYRMRFNERGDLLAGVGWKDDTFALWRITLESDLEGSSSAKSVKIEAALASNEGVWDFCWSPSGRRLARLLGHCQVRVDDFEKPELSFELNHGSSHPFRSLVFPNDDQLAFGAGGFQKWDLNRREQIAGPSDWEEPLPETSPIIRSPDGRFLVIRNAFFDAESMQPAFELPVPDTMMWCLDWSPDGRRLACGFDGGKLYIWDLAVIQERLAAIEMDWGFPRHQTLEPLEPLREFGEVAASE